ncbi:MAG: serine/threonine protein kinase [Deltaproteobacteria bacterium]|nr:serine/threonine protein kinase [Deltaproteobacteria bacterium]
MAEIYRAEAELMQGMKKKVAIKRILPHLTKNQKFVSMFLDEARLSLYLDHANIVHVFDIGRSGNTYFIVMEYVDGINLRNLSESLKRQNRGLKLEQCVFVAMEVCKGLGYAHDMRNPDDDRPLGIVHRDVSPPNILLSRNGEVKLADFGLAKAASQLEQTDPGVVKGKFSYLSPEAASGIEVDYRADIFACGIVLFEMITGRRLFYGETDYQTVELVRQAKIPPLRELAPEVPEQLEQIVERSLSRDPDQRYQHAYEMQDALAQLLFTRGLKVTSRDLAHVVRRCLDERQMTAPPIAGTPGVINHLIQDEVRKFTSLEQKSIIGSRPLSPDELSGSRTLDHKDFIDPRQWGEGAQGTDSGVTSLESMLEGDAPLEEQAAPDQPASRSTRGLLIALVVFLVLAAGALLTLYALGYLDFSSAQSNLDIVEPN